MEELIEQQILEHLQPEYGPDECNHIFLFEGKYGMHTDTYRCKKCNYVMHYHWGEMEQINTLHN